MSIQKKIQQRETRRTFRVRNHVKNINSDKLRITVFRSLKHIYAQLIDDNSQKTVASFSSSQLTKKVSKKELAKQVGYELGKQIQEKSLNNVFFDRGPYKYHGRIAALAEGLRESGLQF